MLLPLDDLLVVAREFIGPKLSRSALARCLKWHGVSSLRALKREREEVEGEAGKGAPSKGFKEYKPGLVHTDVKYLLRMPDKSAHGYLFVAIGL